MLKKRLFLLCSLILLTGCIIKKPPIPVAPTITPSAKTPIQATPKKSKASYHLRGKSYSVMKTSRNYEEQGLASWYGSKFHRRRTSSGERFNMYHLTAAHKTLPLSSYVLVTNLVNGRQVVVKVNDRGPFVSNRLIDLSYAAARRLGMVGRGIAQVNVKAIKIG